MQSRPEINHSFRGSRVPQVWIFRPGVEEAGSRRGPSPLSASWVVDTGYFWTGVLRDRLYDPRSQSLDLGHPFFMVNRDVGGPPKRLCRTLKGQEKLLDFGLKCRNRRSS
jgi:hypothetical protein